MDLLSALSGIWDVLTQFLGGLLGGFLNMEFFIPAAICLLIATLFNPKGLTGLNQLVVSFFFGAIGGYLFVLLVRGTPTNASILALVILAVGLIWLFTESTGWISKLVYGILSVVAISAVITTASLNTGETGLPRVVSIIWEAVQSIVGNFLP